MLAGWDGKPGGGFTITSDARGLPQRGLRMTEMRGGRNMVKRVVLLLILSCGLLVHAVAATPAQTVPDVFVTSFRMDAYPPLARQANVDGDVTAVLHLNGDGTVAGITDVNGPDLLRGEVDMVRSWAFLVPDRRPRQLAIILRYSLRGEPRREASTLIKASLPYLIEITTNPTTEGLGARNRKRTPEIPKANTCFRCG
jgi:hypothetical protein